MDANDARHVLAWAVAVVDAREAGEPYADALDKLTAAVHALEHGIPARPVLVESPAALYDHPDACGASTFFVPRAPLPREVRCRRPGGHAGPHQCSHPGERTKLLQWEGCALPSVRELRKVVQEDGQCDLFTTQELYWRLKNARK